MSIGGRILRRSSASDTEVHIAGMRELLQGLTDLPLELGKGAIYQALGGAARIVLLGYDAEFTDGRKHWHDDHPPELENATSVADWPRLFGILARRAQRSGVQIVNASRATALECFPRVELEAAL